MEEKDERITKIQKELEECMLVTETRNVPEYQHVEVVSLMLTDDLLSRIYTAFYLNGLVMRDFAVYNHGEYFIRLICYYREKTTKCL